MTIFRNFAFFLALVCALNVQGTTTLKLATVSPEGSAWTSELRKISRFIDNDTEGRVKLKIYSGGVMGDDTAVLRKLRARQLSGAIIQTGSLNSIAPNVQLYNMPLFFQNIDEVAYVRENMDQVLMDELEEKNFVSFGFSGVGLAYAMSTSPASNVREARRLKVWAPKGDPAANSLLRSFGITPVPLTIIDVLAGMQTGLIDTVTSPPVAAIALQWHTSVKYILDVPFMYVYGVFVVDKRQFDDISVEDQAIVRKHMENAVDLAEEKGIADHKATWNVLINQGVQVVRPEADDMVEWQQLAADATEDWLDQGFVARDLYEQMLDLLTTYRQSVAVENP